MSSNFNGTDAYSLLKLNFWLSAMWCVFCLFDAVLDKAAVYIYLSVECHNGLIPSYKYFTGVSKDKQHLNIDGSQRKMYSKCELNCDCNQPHLFKNSRIISKRVECKNMGGVLIRFDFCWGEHLNSNRLANSVKAYLNEIHIEYFD